MGNQGWELACLLELPDQRMSGFGKVTMKVLIFFQRKIVPDVVSVSGYAMPDPAHPYPPPPAEAMPEKGGIPPADAYGQGYGPPAPHPS